MWHFKESEDEDKCTAASGFVLILKNMKIKRQEVFWGEANNQ
jgi:hypothetical protein